MKSFGQGIRLYGIPCKKESKSQDAGEYFELFRTFLEKTLEITQLHSSKILIEFFEFSNITPDIQKFKECYVLKRSGGRYTENFIYKY